MDTNNKSAFLTKLPLEVRFQIYKLVFLRKVIGITRDDSEVPLRHCVCHVEGQKFHWFIWQAKDKTAWSYCGTHTKDPADTHPRLPLLLTCRQIYTEAVDVLWSYNPLHIQIETGKDDFRVLSDFQHAILPRQRDSLRLLEVSFLHPYVGCWPQDLDDEWFSGWSSFWDAVKAMRGLVHIKAWIKMEQEVGGNVMSPEQESRLLGPLMDLHEIRDFQVEVTWPPNDLSESLLRDAAFSLTRNDAQPPGKPTYCDGDSENDEVSDCRLSLYIDESDNDILNISMTGGE